MANNTTTGVWSNGSTPLESSLDSMVTTTTLGATTIGTAGSASSERSQKMPDWAIAMIVLMSLMLAVGSVCIFLFFLQARRKRNEQKSIREKAQDVSKRGLQASVDSSSSKASQSSKSPSSRAQTLASAMTTGRTPVLPHHRLAVEVRDKKGKSAQGTDSFDGKKLFSASGVAISGKDNLKLFPNETSPSRDEANSTIDAKLKTVDQFKLGRKGGRGLLAQEKNIADKKAAAKEKSKEDEKSASTKSGSHDTSPKVPASVSASGTTTASTSTATPTASTTVSSLRSTEDDRQKKQQRVEMITKGLFAALKKGGK